MTAVIEPVAPAKQRRETHPGIEATAVQPLGAREQLGQCRGLHLLQTHSTLFGEFVEAHDVIEVDFDVHHINCDAEFLIAYHCADDRSWYGVRRFQRQSILRFKSFYNRLAFYKRFRLFINGH